MILARLPVLFHLLDFQDGIYRVVMGALCPKLLNRIYRNPARENLALQRL
jgi:hypothetical protein